MTRAADPKFDQGLMFVHQAQQLVNAIALIANTLGPVTMDPPPAPVRPQDVGPCVHCQAPTRRYGEHGHAACHHCDQEVPPLIANVPLFPLAVCRCGHVFPIPATEADLEPPCPTCMEDPLDNHDCPLSVKRKVSRRR